MKIIVCVKQAASLGDEVGFTADGQAVDPGYLDLHRNLRVGGLSQLSEPGVRGTKRRRKRSREPERSGPPRYHVPGQGPAWEADTLPTELLPLGRRIVTHWWAEMGWIRPRPRPFHA